MSTIKQISIEELVVNRENPRFSILKREQFTSEYDAALALVNKNINKMYNLIVSISSNYELHSFIISYDGNKPIVSDGNRRLTAMKLLKKMIYLPKDEKYKKINEYLVNHTFNLDEVYCDCYGPEEKKELDYRLDKIHTKGDDTIDQWHPYSQYIKNNLRYTWMILFEKAFPNEDISEFLPFNVKKYDTMFGTSTFNTYKYVISIENFRYLIRMQDEKGQQYLFSEDNLRYILSNIHEYITIKKYRVNMNSKPILWEEIIEQALQNKKYEKVSFEDSEPINVAKNKVRKPTEPKIELKSMLIYRHIPCDIILLTSFIKSAVNSVGEHINRNNIHIKLDFPELLIKNQYIQKIEVPQDVTVLYSFFDEYLKQNIENKLVLRYILNNQGNLDDYMFYQYEIPISIRNNFFDSSVLRIIKEVEKVGYEYPNLVAATLRVIFEKSIESLSESYSTHFNLNGSIKNSVVNIWNYLKCNNKFCSKLLKNCNIKYQSFQELDITDFEKVVELSNLGAHHGERYLSQDDIRKIINKQSIFLRIVHELYTQNEKYINEINK